MDSASSSLEHIYHCFPGGRHKAITLSYDDGKTQDRRLVDILNHHGLKGSFNLNGAKFGRDSRINAHEVADLYAGHEVAAHSLTHPTLTRCPREMLVRQIVEDRRRLEDLVGYPVRGFAYPNGQHNSMLRELLPALGIAYARTTTATHAFGIPDTPMEWHPSCHHSQDLAALTETFLAREKTQFLDLLAVWGHSYDFERDDNWEVIERFADRVGSQADIWFATNIEVFDYMTATNRLQFTADCTVVRNPSAQTVCLRVDRLADGKACQDYIDVPGGATVHLFRSAA